MTGTHHTGHLTRQDLQQAESRPQLRSDRLPEPEVPVAVTGCRADGRSAPRDHLRARPLPNKFALPMKSRQTFGLSCRSRWCGCHPSARSKARSDRPARPLLRRFNAAHGREIDHGADELVLDGERQPMHHKVEDQPLRDGRQRRLITAERPDIDRIRQAATRSLSR
jgi:hypothetical protein